MTPLPKSDVPTLVKSNKPAKMVLVVRNDLKMGKGKVAAQCSHATLVRPLFTGASDIDKPFTPTTPLHPHQ